MRNTDSQWDTSERPLLEHLHEILDLLQPRSDAHHPLDNSERFDQPATSALARPTGTRHARPERVLPRPKSSFGYDNSSETTHLFRQSRCISVATPGIILHRSKSIWTVCSVMAAILIWAPPKWPMGDAAANIILACYELRG
jgi:hypothetical protein